MLLNTIIQGHLLLDFNNTDNEYELPHNNTRPNTNIRKFLGLSQDNRQKD